MARVYCNDHMFFDKYFSPVKLQGLKYLNASYAPALKST